MGWVYNRQTDDYDWVDEGDEPKSPYEQAHEAGNGDAFDKAVQEYYAGSGSPNAVQMGPNYWVNGHNDIAGHDPVNWYNPASYNWLVNTPGGPHRPDPNPTQPTGSTNPSGGSADWSFPSFGGPWAPDMSYWEDAPNFSFDFKPFDAPAPYASPSADEARAEPGYDFARTEGLKALTENRAAQGLARTGGTLKDLTTWGNRFADQNYSNVDARKRANYVLNTGTLFDIYKDNESRRFDTAKAEFEPRLASWSGKMGAFGNAATAAFNRAWDAYKFAADDAFRHWDTIYRGGMDSPPPA